MQKLFLISSLFIMLLSCKEETKSTPNELPFIGEKQLNENGDEIFHKVAPFEFVNQDSTLINEEYLKGKITVVDFFFTTCPTICPTMTKNMKKVQEHWKDNPKVQFLSHTVDPKTDTPKKLKRFANYYKADLKNWNFVTGEKIELYKMGVKSYLLPTQESALEPGGFLHSEYFVLVDENLHLRGIFDGTKENELDSLNRDIKILLND